MNPTTILPHAHTRRFVGGVLHGEREPMDATERVPSVVTWRTLKKDPRRPGCCQVIAHTYRLAGFEDQTAVYQIVP